MIKSRRNKANDYISTGIEGCGVAHASSVLAAKSGVRSQCGFLPGHAGAQYGQCRPALRWQIFIGENAREKLDKAILATRQRIVGRIQIIARRAEPMSEVKMMAVDLLAHSRKGERP
jgi:hypothetical protein